MPILNVYYKCPISGKFPTSFLNVEVCAWDIYCGEGSMPPEHCGHKLQAIFTKNDQIDTSLVVIINTLEK